MKELNDIVLAYDKAVSENKKTALVTVVQVEGSSYRRPGARMLVTEEGEITGAISGGCLEGDALRKAQLAMHRQENRLEIYDTTDDEEHNLGVQLGCNGIVYILFEPIRNEDANNPLHLLQKAVLKRKGAVLATVFNRQKNAEQAGTGRLVYEEETLLSDDQDIQTVFEQKKSAIYPHRQHSVLLQYIPPVLHLVIVGAGNDVQPLAEMASLLGWNITVADGRPAYATRQRFPKANKIALVKAPDILSAIQPDEQTAVVLMTHNYNYDVAALERFLPTDCPYIGVLGPKKKLNKMLDELLGKGLEMNEYFRQKLYGPVGLDIGAETSEEIALSIISEIKAVFSSRQGASLKDRPAEIHERFLI